MPNAPQCARCGSALASFGADALCPKCMIVEAVGLGLAAAPSPDDPSAGATVRDLTIASEGPGARIGRYRLLERIGEGGMGTVWMAEQVEPVRRMVALKLIKPGMDSGNVLARFEAERQALALMDHPNIAKILDAGMTGDSPRPSEGRGDGGEGAAESEISNPKSQTQRGRPYFVMELVKGISITKFCDERCLSIRERLELFMPVCQAIQHAHQKGIIHRDIKPSNVLVALYDGRPVPKVIDFGIAKATGQQLTERTLFTGFGALIGTPEYMSPEQAELNQLDIDTRSDIYSLGVLLYELLTGTTPLKRETLRQAAFAEILRRIREEEPPKPSTRLSTLVAADASRLASKSAIRNPKSAIDKDLDWIVMKALEKDRSRRYDTANGFALDLQRHLDDEPIVARPPSAAYRFQKFYHRNKLAVGLAASVTAALTIGTVVSTWQAIRATKAEHEQSRLRQQASAGETKAKLEASKSSQVARFLKDMLKSVGPSVARGRDTKMLREILDKTSERISHDLTNQPAVEIELRFTIGGVYLELGEYGSAEVMFRRALALRREFFSHEPLEVAKAFNGLAAALENQGKNSEAEKLVREALAVQRKFLGNEHVDVAWSLNSLSVQLSNQGKNTEAEALCREGLAMRLKLLGHDHRDVANSLNNLGYFTFHDQPAEAEKLYREALDIMKKVLGESHPDLEVPLDNLAKALHGRKRYAEAEAVVREALALQDHTLGTNHPHNVRSLWILVEALEMQGKLAEAETVARELVERQEKKFGQADPETTSATTKLTWLLIQQGKSAEAESLRRDMVKLQRKTHGDDHLDVATALSHLAYLLRREAKLEEAEATLRECLSIRVKQMPGHWRTFKTQSTLGGVLLERKNYPAAEPLLISGCEGMTPRLTNASTADLKQFKESYQNLVRLYESTGRPAQAAEWSNKLAQVERTLNAASFKTNAVMK